MSTDRTPSRPSVPLALALLAWAALVYAAYMTSYVH